MTIPIFYLKNIQYSYGTKPVLDIPELTIERGSVTGIIGPNGSGKTTLLKLLSFVNVPNKGQVFYNGRIEKPFSPTIRSKITLLTQKPYLLKRSVYENIVYGLKIRKDTKYIKARVYNSLKTVGLDPELFADRKWHELSGGEAQRVALASRLILKPDALLLDEPIANVDNESARLIREASLMARKNMGTTLVIVSHDIQWLYSISDNQISLYKGKVFSGGMGNIITGPFVLTEQKNILIKELEDSQKIILCIPDGLALKFASTAFLAKAHISLEPEPESKTKNPFFNQVCGEIISMMLERKTESVLVTVSVSELNFALSLSREQISSKELCPGKKVVLGFSGDAIEWV